MQNEDDIERGKTLFESLVYALNMTAMQQIGITDSPLRKDQVKDLSAAKETLDMLKVLQKKTLGNLSEEENRFLDKIIVNVSKHILAIQEEEALINSKQIEVPEE